MVRAYFDNNATTRTHPRVVEAMLPHFTESYVNASSAAAQVLGVDRVVVTAKESMGRLLGSRDLWKEIALTSGASESNSWAIKGLELGEGDVVVSSQIEHPSVLAALRSVGRGGAEVRLVPCGNDGVIDVDGFRAALSGDVRLVSIMLANNETGVVQPVARLAEIARLVAPRCIVHCDMTQAPGRLPLDLLGELYELDLASFSAHKFHGPKGIGGLFIREGVEVAALSEGEQENGRRGGTINSPGAAGLAVAADIASEGQPRMAEVADLRDYFEDCVGRAISGCIVNGKSAPRLPNTTSLTIMELDSADVVDELARRGLVLANGSACSAGSDAPSHVLTAMGIPYAQAFQTLRVSLSLETTADEIDLLVHELVELAAAR